MEGHPPESPSHLSDNDYVLPATFLQPLFPHGCNTEKSMKKEKGSEKGKSSIEARFNAKKQPPTRGLTSKGRRKKEKAKKEVDTYGTYLRRVLKRVHPKLQISREATNVMNSLLNDIFERIIQESSHLLRYNKKATITSREIMTSVRLVLPGGLAKFAMVKGLNAVALSSCDD